MTTEAASNDWRRKAIVAVAVLVNLSAYGVSFATAVAAEQGGGFLSKARGLFTDEMPVPCNVWTCTVNFPSVLVASAVLDVIPDRGAWAALVLPQVSFILFSSLQTALAAWLVWRLVRPAFHR